MKNDQNKIGIIVADENEIFEFPHFMKLKKTSINYIILAIPKSLSNTQHPSKNQDFAS